MQLHVPVSALGCAWKAPGQAPGQAPVPPGSPACRVAVTQMLLLWVPNARVGFSLADVITAHSHHVCESPSFAACWHAVLTSCLSPGLSQIAKTSFLYFNAEPCRSFPGAPLLPPNVQLQLNFQPRAVDVITLLYVSTGHLSSLVTGVISPT